jgi:hypothetical protein
LTAPGARRLISSQMVGTRVKRTDKEESGSETSNCDAAPSSGRLPAAAPGKPNMVIRQSAALPVLWRRWTELISGFAERQARRARFDASEYEALHRALLAACQAMIVHADPEHAAWLTRMQQLVEPWMTAATLEKIDKELLADVLARCRAIDQEMGGLGWSWNRLIRRQRALVTLVLGCLIVPPLLVGVAYWSELSPSDVFETGWRSMRRLIRGSGELTFWFAGTVVAGLSFVLWALWGLAGPRR